MDSSHFSPNPQTGGRRDWPWEGEQTSSSKQVLEKSDSIGTGYSPEKQERQKSLWFIWVAATSPSRLR